MTTRRLLPLAVLLTALTVGPSPASAQPAVNAFTGSWQEDCWGCGFAHGSADLAITGTHTGYAHAEFYASAPGGAMCATQGSASGYISGPGIEIDFYATRLGPWMLITTSGSFTGTGTAAWVTTRTACGAGVAASIAGTIAGI